MAPLGSRPPVPWPSDFARRTSCLPKTSGRQPSSCGERPAPRPSLSPTCCAMRSRCTNRRRGATSTPIRRRSGSGKRPGLRAPGWCGSVPRNAGNRQTGRSDAPRARPGRTLIGGVPRPRGRRRRRRRREEGPGRHPRGLGRELRQPHQEPAAHPRDRRCGVPRGLRRLRPGYSSPPGSSAASRASSSRSGSNGSRPARTPISSAT